MVKKKDRYPKRWAGLIDIKKKVYLEHEAKLLFKERGFSVPKGIFIPKERSLSDYEINLSFPLVAKISSSRIRSKTDIKGIVLDIRGEEELRNAFDKLIAIKEAEGVLIEEMAPPGIEVILGGTIDEQFGPIVMFGLGGIFVELYSDVAFCLAPMDKEDSLWLIKQIKGYPILEGYRGMPPINIDRLSDLIILVSDFMATGSIKEINLNPVRLYPEDILILDAKIETIS